MLRRLLVPVIAAIGAVGFAPPALAAPPLTVAYTDLCGFVELALTNTTGADVAYQVHRSGKPDVSGTVPANGVSIRQEAVNDGDSVSVSPGALNHAYHAPPGCTPPALTGEVFAGCGGQIRANIRADHADATDITVEVGGVAVVDDETVAKGTKRQVEVTGPAPPFDVRILRATPNGSASPLAALSYGAVPAGCGPGSLTLTFTDLCGGFTALVKNTASAFQYVSVARGSTVVKAFMLPAGASALGEVPATDGDPFTVVQAINSAAGPIAGLHVFDHPASCGPPPNLAKSFVDSCAGTTYTLTNADFVSRTYAGLRDGKPVASLVLNGGKSGTLVVPGTTAAAVSLTVDGVPVDSHAFAGCPAPGGGLPVTGVPAGLAAVVAGLALVAGVVLVMIGRRRRARFTA